MGIKNFVAAATPTDDDEVIEFTINNEDFVYASYIPEETQIALFTSVFTEGAQESVVMSAILRFLRGILDKESYSQLENRMSIRPTIPLESLMEIIEYLLEEFTNHPSQRSSGSTPSRGSGGKNLTDHLPPKASTRSRSPRAVSATSSTRGSSKT